MASRIIRLTPNEFVHVLDSNSNITRVEVGPQPFTRKDHEEICLGPEKLIMVPQGSHCIVLNPVARESGEDDAPLVYNAYGQVKLRHGEREVRLRGDERTCREHGARWRLEVESGVAADGGRRARRSASTRSLAIETRHTHTHQHTHKGDRPCLGLRSDQV